MGGGVVVVSRMGQSLAANHNQAHMWCDLELLVLGAVYIMDYEVVLRPCKICDRLLNFSWDHFGLHQRKKRESDHGDCARGVHCDNIRKQRAGKYRVIYIHKRKNLEFS
jgi:hypothetical protein